MTGANSARLPTVEELEALIRDGKSLDGYELDNTEQKEDTQPENFIGYISSKVSKSY